jgi:hypothetical protein
MLFACELNVLAAPIRNLSEIFTVNELFCVLWFLIIQVRSGTKIKYLKVLSSKMDLAEIGINQKVVLKV